MLILVSIAGTEWNGTHVRIITVLSADWSRGWVEGHAILKTLTNCGLSARVDAWKTDNIHSDRFAGSPWRNVREMRDAWTVINTTSIAPTPPPITGDWKNIFPWRRDLLQLMHALSREARNWNTRALPRPARDRRGNPRAVGDGDSRVVTPLCNTRRPGLKQN